MKRFALILWFAALVPGAAFCEETVPALAIFDEGGHPADFRSKSGSHLSVAIYSDGVVIWSRGKNSKGPPYVSGRVESRRVQAVLDRFEREGVFDAKSFGHSWFGPDSSYTTIWLKSGTQNTRLESWHEGFEERPNLVALSSGVTSLNGTTREEALGNDTKEYQRFRRIWAGLRAAIGSLVPKQGEPYTGAIPRDFPK